MEDGVMKGLLSRQGLAGLGWAAVAALLGWLWVIYGGYAAAALHYSFGLDYCEGLVWQQILWTPGPHWYGDITHPPFVVFEYPPIYLLVVKAWAATGLGMLRTGRLVSICATLASCGLVGGVVWVAAGAGLARPARWGGAMLGAMLPIAMLPVISWSILMRVDMLALALSYSGLWLGFLACRRPVLLYGAVLFFVAAIFTKQIFVAAPFCVGLVWLCRAPRLTLRAYGLGSVVGLSAATALEWATHGGFIRHTIFYTADRLDFAKAFHATADWLAAYPLFFTIACGACIALWQMQKPLLPKSAAGSWFFCANDRQAMLLILSLYLVMTSLMLVSAGKIGASRNYFIEWMCCWCVWIGLAGSLALQQMRTRPGLTATLLPFLLVMQIWPLPHATQILSAAQFTPQRAADSAALLAKIRSLPAGPVLSDDMVAVVESGREVIAEPGVLLELAGTGMWDEKLIISMLKARAFSAIITAYQPGNPTFDARYLPRTQSAMLTHYPVAEKFGDYWLRLPAP